MTDRVNVEDAALEWFAGRIGDFDSALQSVRGQVEAEIGKTLGYLSDRFKLWKARYELWRDEAERLYEQYRRCAGGNRDEDGRIPRKCQEIYEQHKEAARRRDEAWTNMDLCNKLIRNVQDAAEAYRSQSAQVTELVRAEGASARTALKTRANRIRGLAADRYAGASLGQSGAVEIFKRDPEPVGGTAAPPAAQWTPGMSGDGFAAPEAPTGVHEGSPGEGEAKEPQPDPEGAEGPARLEAGDRMKKAEREESWSPGGERR